MANLGFYRLGKRCAAFWLRDTSPLPDASFGDAIYNLFYQCYTTWTNSSNEYDKNLWSMMFLLKGSMFVYLALLATIRCTPRYRMLVFGALYSLAFASRDRELSTFP